MFEHIQHSDSDNTSYLRRKVMTADNVDISIRSSFKSSLIVATISGWAGLVLLMQDVVIAKYFATSGVADAYQLAVSFPLLAINVLAGGTLLAVLVPLLARNAVNRREADAAHLLNRVRRALRWLLLATCGIWALAYPLVAERVAVGFSPDALILTSHLAWLSLPILYFSGLAGVDAALLNSNKRFLFVSTLPAFMPFGVIVCIILLQSRLGIYAAAIGLLSAGAIQWLVSRRLAASLEVPLGQLSMTASDADFSKLLRDYGMAAASAAFLAGILLTDTFMASAQSTGSTAVYGYAVRPVTLFLAFSTAVIGNVILPFFSHLVATENWPVLTRHVLFWFGLLAVASLPVVALWYVYADHVVALLYQRGAFAPIDATKVAAVQKIYLLQIPFFLVAVIGWRVMNSLGRHASLLCITAACFLVNLVVDLWLTPDHGLQGIAWGTDLAFALWAFLITLCLLWLRRSHFATAGHPGAPTPASGLL